MTAKGSRRTASPNAAHNRPAPASRTLRQDFLARAAARAGPLLAGLGLEVVRVQCPMEGGRPVLRIFIDRRPEEGGDAAGSSVSLDDCALASRTLEAFLEADAEPQPEGYVLEVSSPGLDRPLFTEADYDRFQGRLVKLKIRRDGCHIVRRGRLVRTQTGRLALETAEGFLEFAFAEVVSGRLLLDEN